MNAKDKATIERINTDLRISHLQWIVADQQETLDSNRIELVALKHDLESTRRERDAARAKVEELESGEEQ